MKLLMFAASLRQGSYNKQLIRVAARLAEDLGVEVDVADFSEFDAPLYNGDLDKPESMPKGIEHFRDRLQASDGLVIASPEYNYSIPGPLKNFIDWVSRFRPMPWNECKVLLLSASPSGVGGNRALWQLRIPLEGCGAFVYPAMFSLSSAHSVFNDSGDLQDAKKVEMLRDNLRGFMNMVQSLNSQ